MFFSGSEFAAGFDVILVRGVRGVLVGLGGSGTSVAVTSCFAFDAEVRFGFGFAASSASSSARVFGFLAGVFGGATCGGSFTDERMSSAVRRRRGDAATVFLVVVALTDSI